MVWFQKIASNTLFQIIARITSSGASFLITIAIARHFGVTLYGEYAKITAFVTLFYLVVDFGLNAVFLQKEDAKKRFKDLFYGRLFSSIILTALVTIVSFVLPYNAVTHVGFSPFEKLGIALFSLTLITEGVLYSTTAIFQRELSYEHFMLATIIGSLATLTFVAIGVFLSWSILFVLLAYVLGGIVESGFALLLTAEKIVPISVDTVFFRKLAKETFPVTLMLFFNLVYFRVDEFILAILRTSNDVATYDLAYKFFDFLIALPLFLSNAIYPRMIEQEKNYRTDRAKPIRYVFLFVIFSLFVLIPAWILAPFVSLIKTDFRSIILPFRILLIGLPFFFLTSFFQWLLIARRQQKFLSFVYLILAVLNIGLNILFIPRYGYIASAIITSVSEAIVLLLLGIKIFI